MICSVVFTSLNHVTVVLEFLGSDDEKSRLTELMKTIGGEIAMKDPAQILMIARAGSFLYNLQTASSDVDYVIVFAEHTEVRTLYRFDLLF